MIKGEMIIMKNLEIVNKITSAAHKALFKVKKHSPEILITAGVIGTVASAVMACKATTKLSDILEDSKEQINQVHNFLEDERIPESQYSKEDSNKDLAIIYAQTGIKLVKLYAPAVALGALSITGIVASNNILRKRNIALAAAYTTVDKTFKRYRNNVIDRFGEKIDKELRYGIKARERQAQSNPNAEADELPYLIMGRNAVREAVRSGRSIDRILVTQDVDGSLREIINLARDNNIRVDQVSREKLDELCLPFGHGQKTGNHQGIVAKVPGIEYCEIADMLSFARERGEKPFIIILDGIEDPHNLGSIIRSAVCAGAHGVIIPRRRAASVTAAATKASAGAIEYAHVAKVANIANAIARLKDEGLWIAGADMSGTAMASARMDGALALVIGSEGDGISRLVKEKCDFLVSIPMFGPIDSLNASVAAAILMFEKRRQDGIKKG